jgi:hypothetical protein
MMSSPNVAAMRNRLIDGELTNRQIVNREKLVGTLRFDAPVTRPDIDALISCMVVEDWVSKWSTTIRTH